MDVCCILMGGGARRWMSKVLRCRWSFRRQVVFAANHLHIPVHVCCSFSTLTLLVRWQEGHLTSKLPGTSGVQRFCLGRPSHDWTQPHLSHCREMG